jgi:hypothetical protein
MTEQPPPPIFRRPAGGRATNVIRTTLDHPFLVPGQEWINAADLPGAKSGGEQEVVYNLGEPAMPNFPILGFAAGTPLLTADGLKRIEDIKPGDSLQARPDGEQPDYGQGDDEHDGPEPPRWWESN